MRIYYGNKDVGLYIIGQHTLKKSNSDKTPCISQSRQTFHCAQLLWLLEVECMHSRVWLVVVLLFKLYVTTTVAVKTKTMRIKRAIIVYIVPSFPPRP